MGPKRLPSLTSYSNDIKGFVWLKHFEKKKKHHLKKAKGSIRLPILYGHAPRFTVVVIEFSQDSGIIPFCLPAHTHVFSLSICCCFFQPMEY